MKKILFAIQKLAISAMLSFGFMFAITNINTACWLWQYQPTPPKSLDKYKNLTDE